MNVPNLNKTVDATNELLYLPKLFEALIGSTQLLNCQWNSSGIDMCQMLKYQSPEPQTYIFS